ncbi:energy-coupling factor transporter transmembrane protein EcfT [Alkalibaculum bacchi]|uniref:energy-coupling factor transporter transmembrane component T family protein n=1 Tax=Alkalibaculum bacchi TaxID=645887 RepID=UPI0026F03141|nr:energy-coupling factor transporter transmembrane component T [Alkalibaculum bacchi]
MKLLLGYNEGDSWIHKLDPRVKLLWLVANLVFVLMFSDTIFLVICFMLILLTTYLSKINLKVYLPMLKIMTVIGIQFILLEGLLIHEGRVLFQIGPFPFYLGGVFIGLNGILRLICLAFSFLQFLMWTSPQELTLLTVKLGLPHKYAILTGMTLYFLPVIEKDLKEIYESQQSRGLELSTIFQKVKGLFPVIMPLILRSLKRTKEVALAMELKGYTRYSTRTFLGSISFKTVDYIALCIMVMYFGSLFALQIL